MLIVAFFHSVTISIHIALEHGPLLTSIMEPPNVHDLPVNENVVNTGPKRVKMEHYGHALVNNDVFSQGNHTSTLGKVQVKSQKVVNGVGNIVDTQSMATLLLLCLFLVPHKAFLMPLLQPLNVLV